MAIGPHRTGVLNEFRIGFRTTVGRQIYEADGYMRPSAYIAHTGADAHLPNTF